MVDTKVGKSKLGPVHAILHAYWSVTTLPYLHDYKDFKQGSDWNSKVATPFEKIL